MHILLSSNIHSLRRTSPNCLSMRLYDCTVYQDPFYQTAVVFSSAHFGRSFILHGTQLKFTSSYHSQTNGQTKRLNRCLEDYLRCFVGNKPQSWPEWLHWAEYYYNTSYHSAIKMSPFKAVYRREPPKLLGYDSQPSPIASIDQLLSQRDDMLCILKSNMLAAKTRMKSQTDPNRRDIEFQVGDCFC